MLSFHAAGAAQILTAGFPALRICQARRIASHDMAWRARMRSMTFSYVIIIYDLAILTLINATLVRHSVLQHCAGKGRPGGRYVYVVYTYTYASLYISSYLYKVLLECLTSYV